MAKISVGVDLGQSPLRVGGLVIGKYLVAKGSKGVKVHSSQPPTRREVVDGFHDVDQVLKFFFGTTKFQSAVVVVPNSTSTQNREAVLNAARSGGYNVVEIINEHTAVAAAYVKEARPPQPKRLAIVSVTGGIVDISIITVNSNYEFILEAQETHHDAIDFEKAQESEQSGPGGLIGLVSGVVGGAVKTLVSPLELLLDVAKKVLSKPSLSKSPVDEVIFVGKAAELEKLKHEVKEKFPNAAIWSPSAIEAAELAAYGAGVITQKQITNRRSDLPGFHGSEGIPDTITIGRSEKKFDDFGTESSVDFQEVVDDEDAVLQSNEKPRIKDL